MIGKIMRNTKKKKMITEQTNLFDEIKTDLKFKRDQLINKLQLVSKEEFNVLKRVVEKQSFQIKKLTKIKKTKKVKKP